eukprot:763340-Hanusia_phi.AAC.14
MGARQAGWDCMRHYEILAAGAIPYFFNLTTCPRRAPTSILADPADVSSGSKTMMSFPRKLVLEAMDMKVFYLPSARMTEAAAGVSYVSTTRQPLRCEVGLDEEASLYHLARKGFLDACCFVSMSLRVSAEILESAWPPDGTFDEGGNLRDMLFHGLRSLLGPSLVDPIRLDHMYDDWFPGPLPAFLTCPSFGCSTSWFDLPPSAQGQMSLQDWEFTERVVRDGLHAWGYFHAGHLPADEVPPAICRTLGS